MIPTNVLGTYNKERVQRAQQQFHNQIRSILEDPKKPMKWLMAVLVGGLIILGPLYYFLSFHLVVLILFVLWIIGIITVYVRFHNLGKDYVKSEIAKQFSWEYDPGTHSSVGSFVSRTYPEVFKRGNTQDVQDQFWGTFKSKTGSLPFTAGVYHYTIVRRDSKGRRRTSHYYRHYFGFKLPKRVSVRFHLYPESVLSKIGNLFSNKEINTESIAFNKTFGFTYQGKKQEKGVDIMRTISPTVQTTLLDVNKQTKGLNVLFTDDTIIFLMNGKMMNRLRTNLFFSTDVHQSDFDSLSTYLTTLANLAVSLSKTIR